MFEKINTDSDQDVRHIFSKTIWLRFLAFTLYCLTANAVADEIAIPSPNGAMRAFWFVGDTSPQKSDAAPVVISLHGCGGQYLAHSPVPSWPDPLARTPQKLFLRNTLIATMALMERPHYKCVTISATPAVVRPQSVETRRPAQLLTKKLCSW